ncbi:SAM-dependent methyltransferase [Actinoplanes sp. NPDC051851]|uniref:SAM-dependent methyltransferase n=1 Tax=Actinoplanes sp. NPDC051851 TaxID=3154753 RepID=UPI0034395577
MSDNPDISALNTSRRYNYWVGGKDHTSAERESTESIVTILPNMIAAAREGREVVMRIVRHLVSEHGIDQILDIGAGQPVAPNVHEVAQAIDPSCRVLYVDNDPLVGVHHRGTTMSSAEGRADFLLGDLREVPAILGDDGLTATLDPSRPVAVLLGSVLHLIGDDQTAHAAVRDLRDALAPGSLLAIVHGTFDTLPEKTRQQVGELLATGRHGAYRARSRDEILAFVDGLPLVEPGIVSSVEWHPDPANPPRTGVADAMCWTVVARIPEDPN